MTIPITVLMIACILPILCGWISGYFRHKQLGMVDNKHPRAQNTLLTGAGARADAAQKNAWEALVVYIAALLAVTMMNVPVEQYATISLVFLALRVFHAIFYVTNMDVLRSLAFVGAYGVCMYMFYLAL